MLTVQDFPSALSVPTTLAARPLSVRWLLRTLRLALRDGGGRAGTGSATPSTTLAFAPASRFANMSLISSIERSICSVVIALTPPLCSAFMSRGTSKTSSFRNTAGWFRITFSIALRPPRRKAACISRMGLALSPVAHEGGEGRLDLAFAAGLDDLNLQSECTGSVRYVSLRALGSRIGRIDQHGNTNGLGQQLVQQLQHYLGHKNIQDTVRYTEMAPDRFRNF